MARNTTDEWFTLNIHSCDRCNLKTSDSALFQQHHCKPRQQQITAGVSYSLASATFTCSLCTVQLPETEFREHLEGHLSLKPYGCKYCGEDFTSRSDVYRHLLSFHAQEEQIFVLRLSGRTKEIMQKAKNNGKEFYKPVNVLPSKSNSGDVAISKTLSQNLSTMPRPPQKQTASVASYSLPSGLSSSSSVRNRVPTVSPPVALETHSHAVIQSNSNASLASARPQQLPAGQKRYLFVLTPTQPQTVSVATPSSSVLQTQAPSCLSQNVSTATTQAYRLPQKLPSPLVLPYVPNNLPVLLPAQRMTRGIHLVTNVSPTSVNQLRNPPALTVPPIFHLNQAILSPLSIENTTGMQMTSTVLSSLVHNVSASSSVASNVPIARTDPAPSVSPTLVNPPLAPDVTASSEDSLRNTPVMSVGVSVSCQNSTESDADNIYKVSIQPFHKDIKSNVDSDVSGDFAESGSQQINQNASSSVTQFVSTDAVVKNEDSTNGDSDSAMQIRIENIMSLSVCPEEFQQCVQNNVGDTDTQSSVADTRSNMTNNELSVSDAQSNMTNTESSVADTLSDMTNIESSVADTQSNVTDTESSVTDAGSNMTNTESSVTDARSNTTEQQVDTLECKNFSFLHVVKGYCLCLVCHLKWCADSDTFFKHIWEKHTHGEDFSCCPTGYSPYCPRLNTIIKIIYDKSQVQMSDQVKSYFTPKSAIETENEDVHNISSETISSALSSSVERVQQLNINEGPSATVSGRPSSAPGECEQTMPAESALCANESSSSPPLTLIAIHNRQICDSNTLAASDRLDTHAQDMQEPVVQIGEQPEKENSCSTFTSELIDDLNFGGEILLNIAAIDPSNAAASNSGHNKSNNTNTYEDISDDDYVVAINDHRDIGNDNDGLLESLYSDELPLDLSKKTAQADKSYNSGTTTPLLATETADVGYFTQTETADVGYSAQTERLLPENIRKSPDDLTATSSLETETVGNARTRAERLSSESIAMCDDDDDVSLRCFYWCGSCSFSCPKAVEFEAHVQEAHATLDGFPCYYCGFRCLSGKHLIQHMEDHIRSDHRKTFSCSLLENSFKMAQFEHNDMKFILRMLKTSAADSGSDAVFHFACNKCESEFSDLNKLGAHLQESLLKVIECKHCDSFFLNSFSWQKHMAVEHVDLPRMYCIKRKLLCCERKKHINVPLQAFPEDIICLSDTEREAETTAEENVCDGTHLESQTISVTTSALTKIETVSSHVIENSNVCSQTVVLAERHSNHEESVSMVTDGVQVQDNHELISAIPRLLDLVKTSAAIKSALMSAVSLNTGRTSDEQGAVANTEPNSSERRWNSAAHELCMPSTCTTTVSGRRDSTDVDLHGFVRPASNDGNNELREVTIVTSAIGSKDGLLPVENIRNKEEFVQTLLETCTLSDRYDNVKSAMSHAENHTNMLSNDKDPCCQEGVIEIPTQVQPSSHNNFTEPESGNVSALSFIVTDPLNDHCLNENLESYVGQAEAVCGINLPRDKPCSSNVGNSVDNKVGSNNGASSDLDPATAVESQDGDVTGNSGEKVSCTLTRINDCSSGFKDYAISRASSLPDTEVSDFASIPTATLELAEARIILDVSEQSKRENTETTCLFVQDIGADNTASRQESGCSSAVLENIESDVQHGIDSRVSFVAKNNDDQAVSVAVNEKDTSPPVFLPSYHKTARPEDSFASVPSISEDPLSLPLETVQKSPEHAIFQQITKDVVMVDQDFEGAHNSEMGMNGHCTPTANNALKTVSHDSLQIDFNSSEGLECTLQESATGFFVNNVTLDNDTSCGHNLLHLNLNEMSSNKIDRQVEKRSGTYEVVHYNNNNLASTEYNVPDVSNETSCLENAESREIQEENILNLPSHSGSFVKENNAVSGGQSLIASIVTENKDSSHIETDLLDVSNEEDLSNSYFRCECGSVFSCFMDSDGNHSVQPEKSLKTPITGKCVKCRLVVDKSLHLDNTAEHVDSETRDFPTSTDSMSLSKQAIENCVRALKRKVPFNLENSGKISRLENNSSDLRSLDSSESSKLKANVQLNHSEIFSSCTKPYISPEKPKTSPALNPCLETATDIDSLLLPDSSDATDIDSMLSPDSSDVAHGLTSPGREILDSPCKRKSETEQSEGIKSSKLLRINSEKHSRPEETIKKLERSIARSQSLNDDQGTDINVPDSARVRCSICTSVTSPSYTKLSQHIESQHAQDKSARVRRIRSSSLQNAAVQSERCEGTTVLMEEVQNYVTMSHVHKGTTAPQNTGINSETNIKTMVRSKSEDKQKEGVKVDNKVTDIGTQHISEVSGKSLPTVQNRDISASDSKPHFKCSVCIFLTSHSLTEIQQHVKSQHPDDPSAKVNRIIPKCLLSATEHHVGCEDATAPSQKVSDLTRLDLKQCFKCSVCISLSSHSLTEMQQHMKLQHPHSISAKICRVDSPSSDDAVKKRKSGMYKCIQPKCNFIGKWNFEKMREHIRSKHPYYSCGYCKAPYTILALLHNHLRFVHRGKKLKVTNSTIAFDLLFKRVDFSSNEQSADNDISSNTCAVQKKRHGKPSTTNHVKICEAKASSKLQALEAKRHTSSQICDANVTLDQQNQLPEASKSKDTVAQGLKTHVAHSKSESILEHFFKEVSPMSEHKASSAEKLTVSSKIGPSSNNGDPQSAKTERSVINTTVDIGIPQLNLAALLQSQASGSRVLNNVAEESNRKSEKSTTDNDIDCTFAKTLAATHRKPSTESSHVKKTVVLNAASSISPQPAESNTCGNKVTEYQKSALHSSAQEKVSKGNVKKPLKLLSSQHDVKDKHSTATSNHVDKNVNLNLATGVKSSSTVKKQSDNSTHIPESDIRRDNVHEKVGVLCSETASTCVSDAVMLHHTVAAASAIVAPKSISQEQDKKQYGAWMANQLEAQTAAEGDQRKECGPEVLRTTHSKSSYIQNGSKTESMCETAAVPPTVPHKIKSSKIDYPFRCTLCSRKMNCVSDIEKHYASSHPGREIQITERMSKFVYSNLGKCLRWKDDKRTPTAPYLCSSCAFRSTKRSDVEVHIRSVHPGREASVFVLKRPIPHEHNSRSDLPSRVTALSCEASRSHSPTPSNYICNVCNEVKSSEFQFRLHLAKHPGFKHTTQLTAGASYVCPKCGYIAMNKTDSSTHMEEHSYERRFKCSMCEHDGHHKKSVQVHMKSVHKVVDDDVEIIDRDKPGNVDLRPRLVNIDPKVLLVNPFREPPNYLQQLVLEHDIKMLDLPGEICTDILDRENSKYDQYFDINKFM